MDTVVTAEVKKSILLSIAGAGPDGKSKYEDVVLLPDTRVIDVMRGLDLDPDEWQIQRPEGSYFKITDNLYEAVEDRQKVHVVPGKAEAGCKYT